MGSGSVDDDGYQAAAGALNLVDSDTQVIGPDYPGPDTIERPELRTLLSVTNKAALKPAARGMSGHAMPCCRRVMDRSEIEDRIEMLNRRDGAPPGKLIELLMWFGFLGVITPSGEPKYAYDVQNNIRRLNFHAQDDEAQLSVHPAFRTALNAGLDEVLPPPSRSACPPSRTKPGTALLYPTMIGSHDRQSDAPPIRIWRRGFTGSHSQCFAGLPPLEICVAACALLPAMEGLSAANGRHGGSYRRQRRRSRRSRRRCERPSAPDSDGEVRLVQAGFRSPGSGWGWPTYCRVRGIQLTGPTPTQRSKVWRPALASP
jgi:hypothetical protein